MKKIKNWFNFDGKLNRRKYLIYVLAILIGVPILTAVFLKIVPIVGVLIIILGVIIALSVHIRRLHDIGKSGWMVLLFLIPFVNFIFLIYLLFKPSLVSGGISGEYKS